MLGRGLSSLSTWAGVLWVGSLGLLATTVDAADFNFWVDPDSVTECGQAQFMWHGGTAPYELTIYSVLGSAQRLNITRAEVAKDEGLRRSWAVDLTYREDDVVVFVMSDSSGFATGGASEKFVVGPRGSNVTASCNAALPAGTTTSQANGSFAFQIGPSDDNLVQCAYTNFSWVANSGQTVTTPITFEGVIPNGDVVQFQTNDTASWAMLQMDIAQGTDMLFAAWDSNTPDSRSGGVSTIQTIVSGSTTCMTSGSPSSSAHSGGVIVLNALSPAEYARIPHKKRLSTGAIIGIAVGCAVAALAVIGALILFCCRRRTSGLAKNRKNRGADGFNGQPSTPLVHVQEFVYNPRDGGSSGNRLAGGLGSVAAHQYQRLGDEEKDEDPQERLLVEPTYSDTALSPRGEADLGDISSAHALSGAEPRRQRPVSTGSFVPQSSPTDTTSSTAHSTVANYTVGQATVGTAAKAELRDPSH